MNVSSEPLVLPTNQYRRRFLTPTRSSMFIDTSPIAVSNKIKAIQARRTRLNPLPTDTSYTNVRPLNFGYTAGTTNSKRKFTVWTAERLVDRSKDTRLDRISTRQPTRPSVLSTTTINPQSLLWPNYQPSTPGNKQHPTQSNSTTITPPAISSIKNKSSGGKIPDIARRQNRQPLIDRQNSLTPLKPQAKSPQIPIVNPSERTINNNDYLPAYEVEEEEEDDILLDTEFEQYFEQAIVKCADWLLKYVFIEKQN